MARKRPLDSGAIAYADGQHAKKHGPGKIQPDDPAFEKKRREWWAWYDAYLAKKSKSAGAQSPAAQPAGANANRGSSSANRKDPQKPVQRCPRTADSCALVLLKANCSHYPKDRSYQLNTKKNEHVLEVKAGSDKHTWDKVTLHTEVRNLSKCKSRDSFYQVSSPGGSAVEKGPDAKIDVGWPGDLKNQWYKYFFPFAVDPVLYTVRSSACPEENDTKLDIRVYPDIELKVEGTIDVRRDKDTGKRESALTIEYKVGNQKVALTDVIQKINQIIALFIKTKQALDTVSSAVQKVGVASAKCTGPTVGISLAAQLEEDGNSYAVKKTGKFHFIGKPIIGFDIEADIIAGVIKVLQGAASSTGVGVVAAGLLQVVEFGRKSLGAGLYLVFAGGLNGEIGAEIMTWPNFEPKGKLGGDVVLTLTARAAKPGSSFILKFLSHVRVGGQGGLEWYATKVGFDKKGAFIESECAFTGLALFYGKAKTPKTTRVSDSGTYFLIEKKDFWKGERTYFWKN